jgi:hypothetical protein
VSRESYFLALAVVFISVAFTALCTLGVAIGRYGSNTAMTVSMGVAVAVSMWMAMSPRKPSQPANYPRFEHLRIAGHHAPTGASMAAVSPLHLR